MHTRYESEILAKALEAQLASLRTKKAEKTPAFVTTAALAQRYRALACQLTPEEERATVAHVKQTRSTLLRAPAGVLTKLREP